MNRMISGILAAGLVISVAAPAFAQSRTAQAPAPVPAVPPPSNATRNTTTGSDLSLTTPAPVPNTVPERVSPANRIDGAGPGGQAHASGPANGTPFSSSPSGFAGSSFNGPQSRVAPSVNGDQVPNVSK